MFVPASASWSESLDGSASPRSAASPRSPLRFPRNKYASPKERCAKPTTSIFFYILLITKEILWNATKRVGKVRLRTVSARSLLTYRYWETQMEIESEQRTIVIHRPDPAVLRRAAIVEAGFAKAPAKRRIIFPRWKMRFRPWLVSLLLSAPLFSAAATFAQYNPLPNPIEVQEIAGPAQGAVRASQNNSIILSQSPYLGGVPSGKLSATPITLSLQDAVTRGLRQNLGGFLASDSVTDARTEMASPERVASECSHRYRIWHASNRLKNPNRPEHNRSSQDYWSLRLFRFAGVSQADRF